MNITKPAWRRRVAMVCVGALAALGWTTVGDAAHAAADLPAAQFASVSGSGACAANEQAPATYTGTFAAKLQMTELLKPFETQVKSEADAGHFPWDKDTVSTSASFDYTVTFPQGTTVQAASASESSSMIASVTESPVNSDSLTHTFKIKLNDVNWAQIYAAYQQDTSNPSAHTVDVTIPYSIAANSADEAKAIAARNVTATGSFSFYPSRTYGRFGLGLQTFNMDAFSAPVASDMSAFPCFTPAAPVEVSQAGTLPGDLLGAVDSGAVDTEHDAVAVAAGQSSPVSLTGALYTDPVKDQMAAIERQYSQTNSDFPNIALSNVDFGFEAVLTLPEGMAYTDASKSATLSGSDDFKVSSVVVSGQTATVKFALTDAAKAKVRTYADLKAIVDAVASPLQVTVAGVVFTSASSADTEYTVKGSVSGSFAALASKSAATGGREIQFNLTWTGEQKTGLGDAKTQPGITYTVKYKAAPVEVSQAGTLPGDLLGAVDSGAVDTEHDAVAVAAGQSSPVSLTGALYTDPVKDQMAAIERQYSQTNSDFPNIALSNVDFGFEAVLTLPEGMAYTDASKSATLSGSDDFKVSSVVVSGQTATVKFALTDAAKAKVRTYADLKAIVDAVASPLQVTVAGVVFTSASSADTEYTVKGSVSGSFAALASKSAATGGREIQFNLTWTGEQKTGLGDAKTQPGITYTVKYKAAPVKPTTPTEPTKNTTKTSSTSQTLAKTGFSGALVGGLGMLCAAAGAVAVRQKRD